jgi:hypothetical protein
MKSISNFILVSAIAVIFVCVGEFVTMVVFGAFYPGYSQLKDTLSALGATASPVSAEMSAWWIFIGVIFIFFGIAVKKAFPEDLKYAKIASWIIIIYGLGEGLGSGAFKADHLGHSIATSLIIHDTLGGIGVVAILILPLIMLNMVPKNSNPRFHTFSKIIFVVGVLMVLLFLFRYSPNKDNYFLIYKGLWQRLFMLNTYIYTSVIAIMMIKKYKFKENQNANQVHQ